MNEIRKPCDYTILPDWTNRVNWLADSDWRKRVQWNPLPILSGLIAELLHLLTPSFPPIINEKERTPSKELLSLILNTDGTRLGKLVLFSFPGHRRRNRQLFPSFIQSFTVTRLNSVTWTYLYPISLLSLSLAWRTVNNDSTSTLWLCLQFKKKKKETESYFTYLPCSIKEIVKAERESKASRKRVVSERRNEGVSFQSSKWIN